MGCSSSNRGSRNTNTVKNNSTFPYPYLKDIFKAEWITVSYKTFNIIKSFFKGWEEGRDRIEIPAKSFKRMKRKNSVVQSFINEMKKRIDSDSKVIIITHLPTYF